MSVKDPIRPEALQRFIGNSGSAVPSLSAGGCRAEVALEKWPFPTTLVK
jgi:hypothetical protein